MALLWGLFDLTEHAIAPRPWTFSTYETRHDDGAEPPHALFLGDLPSRPTYQVSRHVADLRPPDGNRQRDSFVEKWVAAYLGSGGRDAARQLLDRRLKGATATTVGHDGAPAPRQASGSQVQTNDATAEAPPSGDGQGEAAASGATPSGEISSKEASPQQTRNGPATAVLAPAGPEPGAQGPMGGPSSATETPQAIQPVPEFGKALNAIRDLQTHAGNTLREITRLRRVVVAAVVVLGCLVAAFGFWGRTGSSGTLAAPSTASPTRHKPSAAPSTSPTAEPGYPSFKRGSKSSKLSVSAPTCRDFVSLDLDVQSAPLAQPSLPKGTPVVDLYYLMTGCTPKGKGGTRTLALGQGAIVTETAPAGGGARYPVLSTAAFTGRPPAARQDLFVLTNKGQLVELHVDKVDPDGTMQITLTTWDRLR
jgi:hypothetical protein